MDRIKVNIAHFIGGKNYSKLWKKLEMKNDFTHNFG
jgi:hypothetical protein